MDALEKIEFFGKYWKRIWESDRAQGRLLWFG